MITVFYDHVLNAMKQTGKSLKEVIGIANQAGIQAFEMDFNEIEKKGIFFSYRLKKLGMPINSCYKTFDWGNNPNATDYKRVVNMLKRRGIKKLLVIPGFVAENDDRNACMSNMLSVLKNCITYANKKGIKIHMEDFDDSIAPFGTIEELKWFMDNEPRLSIAFDTGNFLYSEQDALAAYPVFKERIGYVHCKDRSFTEVIGEDSKATVNGRSMYSAAVGFGVIPMKEIIEKLKETGYDGAYAIEHFGSLKQLDDMVNSAKWLKEQGVK